MAHNTINIQGKPQLKTPLLYCINKENQVEITMLVLSRTILALRKFNLQLISKLKAKY